MLSLVVAMSALNIRGVNDRTAKRLKERARRYGVSVNRLVLSLLQDAVGTAPKPGKRPGYHDLDSLFGTWSD
jgi:plasmid stability protein